MNLPNKRLRKLSGLESDSDENTPKPLPLPKLKLANSAQDNGPSMAFSTPYVPVIIPSNPMQFEKDTGMTPQLKNRKKLNLQEQKQSSYSPEKMLTAKRDITRKLFSPPRMRVHPDDQKV